MVSNKKKLFSIKRPGGRLALIMIAALIIPLFLAASAAAGPQMPTPTNLAASDIGYHEMTISWTGSPAAFGFKIKCKSGGSTIDFSVPAGTYSYECTGLNANTEYTFQVMALGNFLFSDSDYCAPITAKTKNLTIPTVLKTPTNLQAIAASASVINLTWNDESSAEEAYVVQRKTGNGSFQEVGTTTANAQSYSDTGLAPGTEYSYRIYAKSASKKSMLSNEATATTQGSQQYKVIAPTNLTASAVSTSQINLSWTINSLYESGFTVERKSGSGSFGVIKTLASKIFSYSDSGLVAGTTYTYRVRAKGNGINLLDSDYSNEVTATTNSDTPPASNNQTILCFYIGSSEYYLNEQLKTMDAAPLILEGRTMLPIAYAATPLGVAIDWNAPDRKVTLSKQGTIIELWIDQSTAKVNGAEVYIDSTNPNVAPRIVGSRTMLPIGFIALNLNCAVNWNPNNQEVKVTYPQ